MTKNPPLISILICNYNYEEYIEESLNSAINQDYPNIEIIIIDDGSVDTSLSIIKELIEKHPDITISLNAKVKNEGLCHARNDAINAAAGEYFVFLDSDDTMPSDYVSNLYKTAIDKNADVVYGDVNFFGDNAGKSNEPDYDPQKLLLDNYINISTLVKSSELKSHRFDTKLNRKSHEDYDFWVGLSLMGLKFVKANDVYLNYRIQSKSRNRNTQDLESRTLVFIDVWTYMMEKYRKRFSISDSVVYAQIRYQVVRIGDELNKLNKVVHEELNPEIQKEGVHIRYQERLINEYKSRSEKLEEKLKEVLTSREYRVGHSLLSKARKVKKILRG